MAQGGAVVRGGLDGCESDGHNDSNLTNMLIESARIGSVKRVTQLLKAGCSVNARDESGKTALHAALASGHADVCLVLVSRGADPYLRDHRGEDCSAWAEEALVGEDLLSGHSRYSNGQTPPQEVASLASHLGIAKEERSRLIWIAEAALKAPLPCDWVEHTNDKGEVFYFNAVEGQSTWEHPMDPFFKLLASRHKNAHKAPAVDHASHTRPSSGASEKMSTPASRLSTASTAVAGVYPNHSKHSKQGLRASELTVDTLRNDQTSLDYAGEGQRGTSAWGGSKIRASTATKVPKNARLGEMAGDRRGRATEGGRVEGCEGKGEKEASEARWEIEDLQRECNKAQGCVTEIRRQVRGIQKLVAAEASTLVQPGAIIGEMIKMSSLVKSKEAIQKAAEERGRREASKVERLESQKVELQGNVRVFCRVRKVGDVRGQKEASTCTFPLEDSVSVCDQDIKGTLTRRAFAFDRVFEPEASQASVFEGVSPMVMSLMQGCNVCVFAYGQTGTGKTYTMEGPVHDPGIHYRAVRDIFREADHGKSDGLEYDFKLSVLEIYNERVFDLLVDPRTAADRRKNKQDLAIKFDGKQGGVRVEGLTDIGVVSVDNVIDIIELAGRNRCIGVTSANEHSSRSHLIVTLNVTCRSVSGIHWNSKIHLVDLAGSERQSKTNAKGGRMVESSHINKSLAALHDVISSLSKKEAHIPYRNSKLTQLLQDSLSGSSQVLMLVTISPLPRDAKESVSSLMLAKRVRSIEFSSAKKEVANAEYSRIQKDNDAEVSRLQSQLSQLEHQLKVATEAAAKTKGLVTKKKVLGHKKHEQDRVRWHEDRDELIQATEKARREASMYKEKLEAIQGKQQQLKVDQAQGDMDRVREGLRDDVSVAPSSMSICGDPGQRLDAWRLKVAELTREIEDRDAVERKLESELKAKGIERQHLQEMLRVAEKRLEAKEGVTDIISAGGDGRSLYERLNQAPKPTPPQPPKLAIPPRPPSFAPQAPATDRTELHRRRIIGEATGGLMRMA